MEVACHTGGSVPGVRLKDQTQHLHLVPRLKMGVLGSAPELRVAVCVSQTLTRLLFSCFRLLLHDNSTVARLCSEGTSLPSVFSGCVLVLSE